MLNAVDAKGRLSVPSFVRQKIERRSDEKVLVLAPHADVDCLIGYDTNWSGKLLENAERRLGDNPDPMAEMELRASLFASTVDVPYDTSGRIILPPRLKRRAGIEDLALFIGMAEEFQVWNPSKALQSSVKRIRDAAADALADRDAA